MDEKVRQRALRKLLHITFPEGKELCYKSATMTFVEALQTIDKDRLQEVFSNRIKVKRQNWNSRNHRMSTS